MTAEQLHDALGMLPSDLIAETDKLRSRPHKTVIYWRQLVAVAACAVLVLGCGLLFIGRFLPAMGGASTECAVEQDAILSYSANQAAPEEKAETGAAAGAIIRDSVAEVPMEEAEEGLTPTGYPADGAYFIDLSAAQVCMTNLVFNSCLNPVNNHTDLIRSHDELDSYYQEWNDFYKLDNFQYVCAIYDEDWFKENDLLMIKIFTESSEYVPAIDSFILTSDTACEISISLENQPEDEPWPHACWHILLPVEKGLLPEGAAIDIK